MKKLPKAADRTIDIFTGKTKHEEYLAAIEDIEEDKGNREPVTPEWLNKRLEIYKSPDWDKLDGIRLIKYGMGYYIERITDNGSTYSGTYFSKNNMIELAKSIQTIAKDLF